MALRIVSLLAVASALLAPIHAHGSHAGGSHDPNPLPPDADWATRHMKEEHHISEFDPSSFFALHDYDDDGLWEPSEILTTYGMNHESNANVSEVDRSKLVEKILDIFDTDKDGFVDEDEFEEQSKAGKKLPDLGYGPGHHGDDEYEYDIHHFEKYHNEDTTEDQLTHPEDIEHFRKHDAMDAAAAKLAEQEKLNVVEGNIPMKFRRT